MPKLASALGPLLLIAAGGVWLAARPIALPEAYGPAALMLLGLWGLGRAWLTARPKPFTVARGATRSAQLRVRPGAVDVRVTTQAEAPLATGNFPGRLRPSTSGPHTSLALRHSFIRPYSHQPWDVAVSAEMPWTFDLASGLGDWDVDLSRLTTARARLRSFAGDVRVTLPATGLNSMDVRLTLGNLIVRVPEGLALKLKLKTGWLSKAPLTPERFIRTAPNEWVTPHFSTAPHQCTLAITLTTGDLTIE